MRDALQREHGGDCGLQRGAAGELRRQNHWASERDHGQQEDIGIETPGEQRLWLAVDDDFGEVHPKSRSGDPAVREQSGAPYGGSCADDVVTQPVAMRRRLY